MALAGKRSTLKASIMKISKFSNSITEDTDSFDIQTHYEKLVDSWTKYEEVHMKIVEETGASLLEFEQIEYGDTETVVMKTHANLKRQLSARNAQTVQNATTQSFSKSNSELNQSMQGDQVEFSGLRVPRVNVPIFSGEYLEWPSFRDLFLSLVGNNPKIPNVQKLSYLKKVVTGDTLKLIRNIKITSNNYQAAWEILESRFENERIIVNALLNNIFIIPNATGTADGIKFILDTTIESLRELKNLNRPIEHYDDWLVFLIVRKLDKLSLEKWNETIGDDRDAISWDKLEEFLNTRFRILEGANKAESKNEVKSKSSLSEKSSSKLSLCHVSENNKKSDKIKCYYCKQNHRARACFTFKKKNPSERRKIVESANLCFNCLSPSHKLAECSSTRTCVQCGLQHHTLLHLDSPAKKESNKSENLSSTKMVSMSSDSSSSSASLHHIDSNKDVLLATAIITVRLEFGNIVKLKALLDQGSQMSLITSFAVKRLRLRREPYTGVPLTGPGGEKIDSNKGIVNFTFNSRINDSQFQTEALVLDTVSQYQQSNCEVFAEASKRFPQIELADPDFDVSSQIDVLLAADVYAQIVKDGLQKFCGILIQNTHLGWILSGQYKRFSDLKIPAISVHHNSVSLDALIRSFWEIEEIPVSPLSMLSVDELSCEKHYQETHSRNRKGRYVVRLPFKLVALNKQLGYSRGLAISSQIRMENRFKKNSVLKEKYTEFMSESLRMGHMELVPQGELDKPTNESFYMPHHAVLRDSLTTALRVVFNASQKTSTGVSLNDLLYTGPKLQSDLFDILTRFRKYKVCYMADMEKMYRRILVHKKDRDFQRIVWRENSNDQMKTYRMRVVTDGTSSAPFMALRTVKQLAKDEKSNYPLAYGTLIEDMFMDDMLSGKNDILSGIEHIRQINDVFKSAGMKMRKWTSNVDDVLQEVSPDDCQNSPIEFNQQDFVKVLGIQWFPSSDVFGFKVRLPPAEDTVTKRLLLSHASKLFDPLGFLSPCTIIPKMLIQKLWELKLKWDDPLPEEIKKRWIDFRTELSELEQVKIQRFIGTLDDTGACKCEIHGFSDASKVAYSAVVYTREEYQNGKIRVNFVAAKTKVAPIKKITNPSMELCGALLVSRLLKKVLLSLKVETIPVYGWTDSEIVLGWLNKSPGIWQQFVGNRTSQILEILPFSQWDYVDTKSNPADCASRGILPSQLVNNVQWWNGPEWLSNDKSTWPSNVQPFKFKETDLMKKKSIMNLVTVDPRIEFLERFSSLQRLIRMTAWCMRFINNIRKRISERTQECLTSTQPVQGLSGSPGQNLHQGDRRKCRSRHQQHGDLISNSYLTVVELKEAMKKWIKNIQEVSFSKEIPRIKSKRSIRRGKLRKLNPKLDLEDSILRVGGRLTNAHMPFAQKYPIVLPKDSHLTTLIIADAHIKMLHGNVQLMLNYLRQQYWILGAREIVRRYIRTRCKICIKLSQNKEKQQMADLPRPRVEPSLPFTHTGVDFAGPVYIRDRGRGKHKILSKGYVAVFICLSTKAVHLEVAEDLSTKEFIEAFKRFVSRHSIPAKMYSDNGSNFVSAATELTEAQKRAMREQLKEIASLLANDGVEWEFNPPTGSHFGGIWEAAVKSMKYHLKRIVGIAHLTHKELSTVLCQIECALNSRPLCALTDDVNDFNVLTPGHFLIGKAPSSLPEESLLNINENRLTKFERTQQMYQSFWKCWSTQYLSGLQQRSKWFSPEDNLKVGELVIMKEDDVPPTKWLMGRIIQVHPGNDGLVRVVTVRLKCKHSTLTRPIHKLCRLPFLRPDELEVGL